MRPRIGRIVTVCISALCAFAYACVANVANEESSSDEQASTQLNGTELNGSNINGSNINGSNINGMSLVGFKFTGATQGGVALTNLRVEMGELVAELNSATVRGPALAGARLQALAKVPNTSTTENITYRIATVAAEVGHDPTGTGSTFLYTVERLDGAQWVAGCPVGPDGDRAAIPLAAEWDENGNRTDDSSMFTLACTSGAIAKCYRWGYRPWVTGRGDLVAMHWTCTRLARADYCGNGTSYTYDGHLIDVWDNLTPQIQFQAAVPGNFDAGWNTSGATCISQGSWDLYGELIGANCPTKSFPRCESQAAVISLDPTVRMFRETY
jgi:hypothetical protein